MTPVSGTRTACRVARIMAPSSRADGVPDPRKTMDMTMVESGAAVGEGHGVCGLVTRPAAAAARNDQPAAHVTLVAGGSPVQRGRSVSGRRRAAIIVLDGLMR
jgi:hypothetical protein